MMKVIQVVPSVGGECAGPSYSVPGLAYGLFINCVDTELHFLDKVPSYLKNAEYKVVNYSYSHRFGLGWSFEMYKGLKSCCNDADIIHTNGLWMFPHVYPSWVTRGKSCKVVFSPRGSFAEWSLKKGWIRKKIFGYLFQYAALRDVDMFHATSEKEYREIRALGYKQPVAIVPIGMDIPQGKGLVDKNDKKRIRRIVFFGRIHKVKAVDNLVRAWGALSVDLLDWELVIAGPDCGAKEKLEEIIAELNIPRVRFTGELNGQSKYDFLSDADIYVLPSHTENFGVTVAEALASGVPTIASQGTPWQGLEIERCGRWVSIGVAPLIRALRDITSLSDDERRRMGERGRQWIARDFSWKGIGCKMKASYEWLVNGAERPNCVIVD